MDEMVRLEQSSLAYRILDQCDVEQLYKIYPTLPHNANNGCPSCGKNRGEWADGVVELNGVRYQCNCQDQLQRYKHYLNSGIGLTYQVLDWSDFHGDQFALNEVLRYRQNLDDMADMGRGLLLFGEQFGSGKTMLAMLVLKEFVKRGYRCYATTFADMLASMKAGWKDAEYSQWYKSKIDSAQVLLLDDVGKEILNVNGFNDQFAKTTFDGILRTRTQQGRVTLITMNMSPSSIKKYYGEAAYSLMTETMQPLNVNGHDYRMSTKDNPKGYRRIY